MRGDPLRVEVDFDVIEEFPGLDLSVYVTSARSGVLLFEEFWRDHSETRLRAGTYRAELAVPPLLNVADYTVGVWVGTQHEDLVHLPVAAQFTVHGSDPQRSERQLLLGLSLAVHPRDAG